MGIRNFLRALFGGGQTIQNPTIVQREVTEQVEAEIIEASAEATAYIEAGELLKKMHHLLLSKPKKSKWDSLRKEFLKKIDDLDKHTKTILDLAKKVETNIRHGNFHKLDHVLDEQKRVIEICKDADQVLVHLESEGKKLKLNPDQIAQLKILITNMSHQLNGMAGEIQVLSEIAA